MVHSQALPRALARSRCINQAADLAQSGRRHAAINRLVLARPHEISFVPDAYIAAAVLHPAVECNPRRPVLRSWLSRVGLKVLERAPVLDEGAATNVTPAEKPRVRPCFQLLQHPPHAAKQWKPLVQLWGLVYAHADQEY